MRTFWKTALAPLALAAVIGFGGCLDAQEKDKPADPAAEVPTPNPDGPAKPADPNERPIDHPSPDIPGLTRLDPKEDIWIDVKRKIVVIDGRVALREGPLEMFACPKGTKEHESLIAINAKPFKVHTGLLAIGAEAGKPVKWDPVYEPAVGPTVEVLILWKDKDGKNKKMRGQEWIRNSKTKKAMTYDWVFVGSSFWVDEETGKKHYHADSGDFICVSNFTTAMLDIPVKSSQDNNDLLFEANADSIPEKGTKVRLVLIPKIEKKAEDKKADEKAPDQPKPDGVREDDK